LDRRSSVGVGIGMIARGEVALVALAVARSAGALDGAMFAALVLVILATTVLTPIGLSAWAGRIGLPEVVRGRRPGSRSAGPLAPGSLPPGSLAPAYQRPTPARQLDVR